VTTRVRTTLLACLMATGASAADTFPIYVYPAPAAKSAPKLDGLLDDPGWKDAPVVSGFIYYNSADKAPVQTSFRVTYDAQALYFGIFCDEPRLDLLTPKSCPRDSMEVFQTEAIELFVEPNHGDGDYYQIAANAAGSVYDSHRTEAVWDTGATAAAKVQAGGWGLEVAIPWKGLGVTAPKPGQDLGVNVCRDRTLDNARQWTCWAQVAANFHDPAHFANLVLSPTPEQLGALGNEFRRGERTGPLMIFSSEGFSQTSYKSLALASLERIRGLVGELEGIAKTERDPAAAAEIEKRLGPIRAMTTAARQQAEAGAVDGATWARMDADLSRTARDLGDVVWEARLTALLSGL
jgi:hypothetical protein